uniref:Uncharacterized protein n=1 Tax=Amphilophus citrinellus TaxID=61819 RepID=A0A3Q0SWC5_AMPCI
KMIKEVVVILVSKCHAALAEPQICYILDGILFLYGIILTALYCKVKVCIQYLAFFSSTLIHHFHKICICTDSNMFLSSPCQNVEEGIYTVSLVHNQYVKVMKVSG